MSNRLYIPPLPNAKAFTSDEGIRAQIQQSGLLQQGGTATEKIAAENVDLVINGRYDYGATFSQKAADELESLGESSYEGVPLYNPDESDSGRNKGYYDVEQVDVSPAQPNTRESFEYTVGLAFKGTKQTHWRAVKTSAEDIQTGLATGSGGLIGIPATASKVRWFDVGEGKESASVAASRGTEFGTVAMYDPTEPTFDDPTLIYEVDFADESPTDVRVWDDLNESKYYTSGSSGGDYNTGDYNAGAYGGTLEVTQWVHVFHTAFELDGRPVVTNGRLRITFDEAAGEFMFEEWRNPTDGWTDATPSQTDYELIDADLERIGPASVEVFAEFEDTADGSVAAVILSIQRGISEIVVREPDNDTIPTDLQTMLDPIASDQTTDPNGAQTLKARSEVK